jgi:hypothetical protein
MVQDREASWQFFLVFAQLYEPMPEFLQNLQLQSAFCQKFVKIEQMKQVFADLWFHHTHFFIFVADLISYKQKEQTIKYTYE